MVSVEPGSRRKRPGIGSRTRLGQAVGTQQLPAEHVRQPSLLLLLGAECDQWMAGQRVHADAERNRRPRRGELLEHLEVDDVGLSASPVILVVDQPEQPGPAQRPEHVAGELAALLVVGRARRELALRDVAGESQQLPGLLGGQLALDRHQSSTRSSRSMVSSRSTPSSVTATMSSIRAPCRPGR